jgi:hypothetical protein
VLPRTPFGRSEELLQLSFIQSARWSVITGLPDNGGEQVPERLRYDYLLFESNFNGSLEAYIEAFAQVVPGRMKLIWNSSFGFPQPRPVRPFLSYITRNDYGADHFFSAYPNASNTEVLAALRARDLVTALYSQADAVTAQEFRDRYEQLLIQAQRRPEPLRPKEPSRGNLSGETYAFTALTPVRPQQLEALHKSLGALAPAGRSPFANVPGVHFARLVLVDDVKYQGPPQRRDSWRNPYLLTTTTTDGTTDPLKHIYANVGDAANEIWGHCVGYPGRHDEAAFLRYFRRNQIRTNRFFCGYPDASVTDVLAGLDVNKKLLEFAYHHQGDDAETLRTAFVSAFRSAALRSDIAGGVRC